MNNVPARQEIPEMSPHEIAAKWFLQEEAGALGDTERTRLKAIATAISEVSVNYIPDITAGGFLDFANSDWLKLLAKELYSIDFNPATFTVGNIVLSCASSGGPYPVQPGNLIAVFGDTGNRYINTNAFTIPSGSAITASFTAEFAGSSYHDVSSDGSISLVTALPGVSLTNPSTTYSSQSHVGSGTGTLTLAGSPTLPHQVVVGRVSLCLTRRCHSKH